GKSLAPRAESARWRRPRADRSTRARHQPAPPLATRRRGPAVSRGPPSGIRGMSIPETRCGTTASRGFRAPPFPRRALPSGGGRGATAGALRERSAYATARRLRGDGPTPSPGFHRDGLRESPPAIRQIGCLPPRDATAATPPDRAVCPVGAE